MTEGRSTNLNHSDAWDEIYRTTISRMKSNPESMGVDIASEPSKPIIETQRAIALAAGRKPDRLDYP